MLWVLQTINENPTHFGVNTMIVTKTSCANFWLIINNSMMHEWVKLDVFFEKVKKMDFNVNLVK